MGREGAGAPILLTVCCVNCVHALATCVPVMVASLEFICLCTDEPPKLVDGHPPPCETSNGSPADVLSHKVYGKYLSIV